MARGTVVGEKIVSQARTKEFDEGYERTFGDKQPERGRWIWDEARKELVRAEDYRPPERAVDAPIMVDRFYEGATTKDVDANGRSRVVDIGSRAKHRAFMKEKGWTSSTDFSASYYENIRKQREAEAKRDRREVIARKLYEIDKP